MKPIPLEERRPDRVLRTAAAVIFLLVIASGGLFYGLGLDCIDYLPGFACCPFHRITGIPCPGCGMTRAFLTLGQGKITEALALNPFSLPLFSLMTAYLLLGHIPRWLRNKTLLQVATSLVVTLWILNLLFR